MQTEKKPQVVFRFCRPSGSPTREPSDSMHKALRHLAESAEMRDFVANAHAQQQNVVVEVFHSAADGHPLLIHTTATPRKKRA